MVSPLSEFLGAQERTQNLQAQRFGLEQARQAAPQQAAQRDIALERKRLGLQQDIGNRRLQGAQLLQQVVDRVKQVPDLNQRLQIFERVRPQLEQFGVALPEQIGLENVTNEGLVPLETGLGQSLQNASAFQRGQGAIVDTGQGGRAFATEVFDPSTGTVRTEFAPIEGQLTSKLGETAEQQTQRRVRETGEKETRKVSVKAANEAFEQIPDIQTSIANIDDAIQALDEGARTGTIASRLPSIRAASVRLDNIRNRLGLDVVGATTFGALSESELALALDTALPTKLPPNELRAWLIDKKAAQQKVLDGLNEAAVFLSQGGTIAELVEARQAEQAQQPQFTEGQTATNPQTGERIIFRNGQWQPI